jgi:eukaryotic-like serine/threonine-protein kinase
MTITPLTLSKLHHPNVVRLFGVSLHDGAAFVVMEWVPRTLQMFIDGVDPTKRRRNKHGGGQVAEDSKVAGSSNDGPGRTVLCGIFDQLLSVVAYMHVHGLFHRDIKPANILLTDAFELKICDLGFSRWVHA